jgi:hypothetical protein
MIFSLKETNDKLAALIVACSTLILLYIAMNFNGTGDDGDSVQHYLFSRWAFAHPENFYVQWAKPMYVFLTAPIAQFGFTAIKIFNVFIFAATQLLAYATAKKLDIQNTWLVPLFMALAPMQLYLIPSGLTELLWAFWFMLSVYLAVNERFIAATLVMSFLPFVRSEGLIIFCLYAPYLVFKRQFKVLPLLAVGHLVYMFLGAKHYDGDLFWVFSKMSYATLDSGYGSGKWTAFINHLKPFMGGAMRFVLVLGFVVGAFRLVRYWLGKGIFRKEELWLVYGCSAAYFIGHTAFWVLGIFNSFGLARVLVGIMPTFAIIIAIGYTTVFEFIKAKNQRWGWVFLAVSMVWIIQSSAKQIHKGNFDVTCEQIATKTALAQFSNEIENATLYYDNTSVGFFTDLDYFGFKTHRHCNRLLNGEPIPADALIFWDDWFSKTEFQVPLEKLQNDKRLKQVGEFNACNRYIYVFKRDTSSVKITNFLYENDFESTENGAKLDAQTHFSGKYSNLINSSSEFSSGFESVFNTLKNEKGAYKIKITSKTFAKKINSDFKPLLIIEVNNQGAKRLWEAIPVLAPNQKENEWTDFEKIYTFNLNGKLNDNVKIYFWNTHQNNFNIDDFKIEVIE